MLTNKKSLPNSQLQLTITVSAEQFRHAFDAETDVAGAEIKIEGFRPGKAPRTKVVEKIGRQRLEASAIDHAISEVYQEVMVAEKIVPVAGPNVEVESFNAPSESTPDNDVVMTFTATVDVLPEVTITGYEKIKVKAAKKDEATDADVEKVIDELRRQRANLVEAAADVVIAKGMWTDMKFTGSVDGVGREDMNSDHHPIIVGEGQLIPGFEEELIGLKKGEEKTFKITFPKDYHAKALAGKQAEFTVLIHEIKDVVLPPVGDDFAAQFGHKTIGELEKAIKSNVQEEKDEDFKRKSEDKVLEELLKVAKFDVPVSLVNQEHDRLFDEAKERMMRMGMPWEMYLGQIGKSETEVKDEIRDQAEKNVRIGLSLGKLIQEEKIEGTDAAAMRAAMDRLMTIATT